MFRETLLESSPSGLKRKRWPMATAFTLELIVGALLVVLPLLSTGVLPVSARVSRIAPLGSANPHRQTSTAHPAAGSIHLGRTVFAPVVSTCVICTRHAGPERSDDIPGPPTDIGVPDGLPHMLTDPDAIRPPAPPPPPRHIRVSVLSEAQLVNRVDPVYPRLAVITQIHGDVKLHALIARDGSIQSLTVVSGHPVLARAAVDAVSQWRYRPYILNGQPVEVETFITVSFKGIRD